MPDKPSLSVEFFRIKRDAWLRYESLVLYIQVLDTVHGVIRAVARIPYVLLCTDDLIDLATRVARLPAGPRSPLVSTPASA